MTYKSFTPKVTLVGDGGYECEYASYQFQKTERQLREDKIKSILQ